MFLLTFHVVFSIDTWLICSQSASTFLQLSPFFRRQTRSPFLLAGLNNVWLITNYLGTIKTFSFLISLRAQLF